MLSDHDKKTLFPFKKEKIKILIKVLKPVVYSAGFHGYWALGCTISLCMCLMRPDSPLRAGQRWPLTAVSSEPRLWCPATTAGEKSEGTWIHRESALTLLLSYWEVPKCRYRNPISDGTEVSQIQAPNITVFPEPSLQFFTLHFLGQQ